MKMSKEEKEEYRKFLKNTSADVCKECETVKELEKQNKALETKLKQTSDYLVEEYNDYTLNIQL